MPPKTQKTPLTGNMLIAQSGGPTMVINQSLIGAVRAAKACPLITNVYGGLHGIRGILNQDLIDLGRETEKVLSAVAQTPSSALGSVRQKPSADECRAIVEVLKARNVRYFFYIGGNDTAEAAYIFSQEARRSKYDFACFHIPKTVDNDLRQNDHTPGFGSSARFVAQAFMGDNLDNRALGGVKINIVMGRNAGFLTAASALARQFPDDGPHLVYLPERPFSVPGFVRDVKRVLREHGRCVVAVSEGIADARGKLFAARFASDQDSHGNITLGGSGALGDHLAAIIKARTSASRVRADTLGYMQRSFPGIASEVDLREAAEVAAAAVRFATQGIRSGSAAIKRKPGKPYKVSYERVTLQSVAKHTREMPDRFIVAAGNDVTPAFMDYVRPLVGSLPKIGRFKAHPIKK